MVGRFMRTMLQLPSSALWAAVSFLLVAAFQVPAVAQQGPDVTEGNWLVAGPFPGTGANALFKDHLSGPTAEQAVRARLGAVACQSPGGTTVWQEAGRGPDGRIDFAEQWPGRGRAVALGTPLADSPGGRRTVHQPARHGRSGLQDRGAGRGLGAGGGGE